MNVQAEAGKSVKNKKFRRGAIGVSKVKTGCKTCKCVHPQQFYYAVWLAVFALAGHRELNNCCSNS